MTAGKYWVYMSVPTAFPKALIVGRNQDFAYCRITLSRIEITKLEVFSPFQCSFSYRDPAF